MDGENTHINDVNTELDCKNCGAHLKFKPGSLSVVCEYCGVENQIVDPERELNIIENDLMEFLSKVDSEAPRIELLTVKCTTCGAESTFKQNVTSDNCPFCDASLVLKNGSTRKVFKPAYVLPFGLDKKAAIGAFKKWIKGLWFAPNALKREHGLDDRLCGIYLPYWTFDSDTISDYTGERGEDYTVTEYYNTTENGKTVRKSRQVTKTRWYSARGTVRLLFDDVLVVASNSLLRDKTDSLEPWDLENLEHYDDRFLAGFKTEVYQVDLKEGFEYAKKKMSVRIESAVRSDIGGDRLRIHTVNTRYLSPTFKHILLPLWISVYRFRGKLFQFLVNARTGEVQGQRPYSVWKITFLVLFIIAVIILIMNFL
jgi:Zn finger protein HypA/HybF involved in hydrogenase expression